ncbi:MAG: hypothetical protein Q9167_007476 [Letrouitia subvulpina]
MKKADGVRRKWVIKYSVMLKKMEVRNLFGKSHIIEAAASDLDRVMVSTAINTRRVGLLRRMIESVFGLLFYYRTLGVDGEDFQVARKAIEQDGEEQQRPSTVKAGGVTWQVSHD